MFQEAKEFIKSFNFNGNEYSRITELTDVPVGFSVQRPYPKDTMFIPAIAQNGDPDSVALFHVVYLLEKKQSNLDQIPILIEVNHHSRYLNNHFDYDYEEKDCPTQKSVQDRRQSIQPLDAESKGDYFYDHTIQQFIDRDQKHYSGIEILNQLFDIHLSTTRPYRGFLIRMKMRFIQRSTSLFEYILSSLKWVQKNVFGRTLVEPNDFSSFFKGYPKEYVKLISEDSMTILGYRASKLAVVIFGLVGCFGSFIYLLTGSEITLINRLFKNTFFGLCFSITILWLIDIPFVKIIRLLLNFTIWLRRITSFRRVRVRKTLGIYR
jgi:hypothetical protein